MKILIATASKHGSTAQIGAAIAEQLRSAGAEVHVLSPEQVADVADYDAAILGSAVYMGRWMGTARALLHRSEAQLRTIPVWLFSSGPLEDASETSEPADAIAGAAARIGVRGSAVFPGRLSREQLHIGERAVASMAHAAYGDYRDWAAIRTWARGIAADLTGAAGASPGRFPRPLARQPQAIA
jgi:menaquinone-dependent protoporphyrinogen oxidase